MQNGNGSKTKLPPPPGPTISSILTSKLPFAFLFSSLTDFCWYLVKTYGGIVGGKVAAHRLLLVGDRDAVKEICDHKNVQGRPPMPCLRLRGVAGGQYVGVTGNENSENSEGWSEMRKFAGQAMRELGVGGTAFETELVASASKLAENLLERNQEPVEPMMIFGLATQKPLLKLLTSLDLSLEDPRLKHLYTTLIAPDSEGLFIEKKTEVHHFIPGFANACPALAGLGKKSRTFVRRHEEYQKIIDEHVASRDPAKPRDFVDLFLNRMDKEKDNAASGFFGAQAIPNLKGTITDVFGGNVTLHWILTQCFLFLGYNPEVKVKVQREIREVIGPTRGPRWEDRHDIPYTYATLTEVLRRSCVVHLGIERRVTEDTEVGGHFLAKDTIVFPWFYGINHDKKYWGSDAEEFNPERFLIRGDGKGGGDQEKMRINEEKEHMSFGSGDRKCLGTFLGEYSMFLFFVTLMQKLDFAFDPRQPKPSLVHNEGHVLTPRKFKVVFSPLKSS